MNLKRIPLVLLALHLLCARQALAQVVEEQPFLLGPVMINFSERIERQSNALLSDGTYGESTHLMSTVVVSRVIGNHVTGMFTFTHKYGLDDEKTQANIGAVAVTRSMGKNLKATLSYVNVDNPKAVIAGLERPASQNDWLALVAEITVFSSRSMTLKTGGTYTTSTGFDSGQMLAGRVSWRSNLGPRTDLDLSFQALYGLHDDPARGEYDELYANQYQAALGYKVNAFTKLQLAYLFLDNKYPGNPGDNDILRLNAYRMLKTR